MFGQYKRLRNEFVGVLTGKGRQYGGSVIRPEATGYGAVYFAEEMLKTRNDSIKGKTVVVSGAGNVAQFATEKATELGAKVITLSDSSGFIHDPNGIDTEKLEYVKDLKNIKRGRIKEYADKFGCEYYEGKRPWGVKCDVALPCATQNEIDGDDAKAIVKNAKLIAEGANMPLTVEALKVVRDSDVLYAPGKASNAGGVSVSGIEMAQNAGHYAWSCEQVDEELQKIMKHIHTQCVAHGKNGDGSVDYVNGANIAGFKRVMGAMWKLGW